MPVLERADWSATPVKGGDVFTLHKIRGSRGHTAVCALFWHQLGWELRLIVGEELQRSQTCRSGKEWLDTADAWKTAMVEKGWT